MFFPTIYRIRLNLSRMFLADPYLLYIFREVYTKSETESKLRSTRTYTKAMFSVHVPLARAGVLLDIRL